MEEVWKEIEVETKRKGVVYQLTYLVSNLGNVRAPQREQVTRWGTYHTREERDIKLFPMNRGYLKCSAGLVHRLVARAFIPNPDNLRDVNHKDNNKTNNHVDNLEWVSHRRNLLHYFETSDIPLETGFTQPLRVWDNKGKWIQDFKSSADAARFMGVTEQNINAYFNAKRNFIAKGCYIIKRITKNELQNRKENKDLPPQRVPKDKRRKRS